MQVVWGNDTAAVCEKKGCAFDNVRPEAANLKIPTHPKAMTPALGHEVWGGDCSLNKDLFADEQLSTWPGQWRAQWVKREACGPHAHAGPRTYRCSPARTGQRDQVRRYIGRDAGGSPATRLPSSPAIRFP